MFIQKFKYWLMHDDSISKTWEKRLLLIGSVVVFLITYGISVPLTISLLLQLR